MKYVNLIKGIWRGSGIEATATLDGSGQEKYSVATDITVTINFSGTAMHHELFLWRSTTQGTVIRFLHRLARSLTLVRQKLLE